MGKERFQTYLNKRQAKKIKDLVEEGYFDNPSEAIRTVLTLKLDEAIADIRAGPAGVGKTTT